MAMSLWPKFLAHPVCVPVGTGDSSVLRQVTLPIVSDEKWCPSEDKLCAGPMVANKSVCSGDSGGPLVCKQGDRWYQYGINSFVYTCTAAGYPSGFADVAYFSSWIKQQTASQCMPACY